MNVSAAHKWFKTKLGREGLTDVTRWNRDAIDAVLTVAQEEIIRASFFKITNQQAPIPMRSLPYLSYHDLANIIVKNYKIPLYSPREGSSIDGDLFETIEYTVDGSVPDAGVPNVGYAKKPQDFMFLVNARAEVARVNDNECEGNRGLLQICEDPDFQEYISIVPFIFNVPDSCTINNIDLNITINNFVLDDGTRGPLTIFDWAWLNANTGHIPKKGLKEEIDKDYIINEVLTFLNRFHSIADIINFNQNTFSNQFTYVESSHNRGDFFNVYWESYGNIFSPNSFIFVSKERADVSEDVTLTGGSNPYSSTGFISDSEYNDDTIPGGLEVQLSGVSVLDPANPTSNPGVVGSRFRQVTYCKQIVNAVDYRDELNPNTINELALPIADRALQQVIYKVADIRMEDPERIYRKMYYTSSGPDYKNPNGVLANNFIWVYNNGKFTAQYILIDYIIKPHSVSHRHNRSFTLPTHTHERIIDHAVNVVLESVGSPRYQTHTTQQQSQDSNLNNR